MGLIVKLDNIFHGTASKLKWGLYGVLHTICSKGKKIGLFQFQEENSAKHIYCEIREIILSNFRANMFSYYENREM